MFDDVLAGLDAQVLANAAVHAVSVIVFIPDPACGAVVSSQRVY
jgi:hypothetical protein